MGEQKEEQMVWDGERDKEEDDEEEEDKDGCGSAEGGADGPRRGKGQVTSLQPRSRMMSPLKWNLLDDCKNEF